jgi:diacylglycerol kinase family enzyme
VAAFAAAAVMVAFAGLRSIALVLLGAGGVVLLVAGAYWFLAHRGLVRWAALAVALLAPLVVVVLYVRAGLLWVVLLAGGLALFAAVAGRAALAADRREPGMPAHEAAPPRQPFVVMNPRSGGGKVARFGLREKAERLGAEVVLLDGPGTVDVTAVAREAVDRGADLLGVAGGDGTQALVAAVAAQCGVPFMVVSAGTRNHFALDLGLDRDDPSTCLDALSDGVELRVDLGLAGGRTFVNNVSFGVYAEVVQSPAYRDDKPRTTLEMLPDLLRGRRGSRLVAHAGGQTVAGPQAVLVSNNPYESEDPAGLGRRARLDRGVLGVVTVSAAGARQAVGLLRRTHEHGLVRLAAEEVVVSADTAEIPVGIDGEAVVMATPVRCTSWPGALRVRVPRNRPGVPPPRPAMDWVRLRRLASPRASATRPGRARRARNSA